MAYYSVGQKNQFFKSFFGFLNTTKSQIALVRIRHQITFLPTDSFYETFTTTRKNDYQIYK